MKILLVLFLITSALAMMMPCEFISPNWHQGKYYPLTNREQLVQTRYGFDLFVDHLDGSVSQAIRDRGMWMPGLLHASVRFVHPGATVLNLGSQSGLEAIVIGKLIGDKGKLFIFEPSQVAYSLARKNILINDLNNTHLYKVAASDIQTKATLLLFLQNTGGAQVFLQKVPESAEATIRGGVFQTVPVDLVDNVLPKDVILDFALIDVEKMEVEALLGMKQIIDRSPNLVMVIEWQYQVNPRRNQQKTLRLLEWLQSKSYKAYFLEPDPINNCVVGKFKLLPNLKVLLISPPEDIFFVPSHIDPNSVV